MYTEYFGLREAPFSIAPDPRFLYMSEQHREALAHLVFGLNSDGGFVLLTGDIGAGKTTVCRCLLEQIPEGTETAFIFNPRLTVIELLETICDEFGIGREAGRESIKTYVDLLNRYLLDIHGQGKKAILIIDEAQNLSTDLLEQLRLLTNLETNQKKLLQIVLMGQPELRNKLHAPELKQLSQRIVARYHLGPLTAGETADYVVHRLSVAGCDDRLFTENALSKVYRISGGVPRVINLVCDRAMLAAFSGDTKKIGPGLVKKAAVEVLGRQSSSGLKPLIKPASVLAVLALIALVAFIIKTNRSGEVTTARKEINSTESLASASIQYEDAEAVPEAKAAVTKNINFTRNRESALMDLSRLWKIDPPLSGSGSVCSQVKEYGLACYRDSGSIGRLLTLNRPAVLDLRTDNGKNLYVTIKNLKNGVATVIHNGMELNVPLEKIEPLWFGKYTIIWRMPPEYKRDITRGARGLVVKWLDEQMASILNRPVRKDEPVYDDAFIREIKKFQMQHGLKPDGIAGKKTLIIINTYAGTDAPLLTGERKG
jgi:general secretion pathway protein A